MNNKDLPQGDERKEDVDNMEVGAADILDMHIHRIDGLRDLTYWHKKYIIQAMREYAARKIIAFAKLNPETVGEYSPSDKVQGEPSDAHEKEIIMQAFDKVRKMFEGRSWIMEGRGSYRYDDDRYKEEVRYLYEEFDALQTDTWKNIKSKSFEYRNKIIEDYKKSQPDKVQEKEIERLQHKNEKLLTMLRIQSKITFTDESWQQFKESHNL